ncbi:MAG: peptidoglycan DD-metalloendopeptidase family protein, partial [Ignavibacterium sp.]|nr:peptidoglycan DD-metalloendopeptidase family protein [Ignavibacterium sp.]
MVKLFNIFLFLIFVSNLSISQNKELDIKKKELENLRNQIKLLEQELLDNQKQEKKSYNLYQNLTKQKFYLEKIISQLRNEENQKSNQIEEIKNNIKELENKIERIKSDYSKYIVYNYKYGRVNELEALFNANSLRQAFYRIKYLRDFSSRMRSEIKLLNENISELNKMQNNLLKEVEEKRLLAAEKNKEISLLNSKIISEEKLLSDLRKDRNVISKQISDKRKSEIAIKNLIDKLIAESERPKIVSRDNETSVYKKERIEEEVFNNEFLSKSVSFSQLKGTLPFPVSRGKIISEFGNKQNVKLNTISINYGIDILCSEPTVRAVSNGIVSAIEWLPGFGTVVIISHNNNFRTVYGHLENIQVS